MQESKRPSEPYSATLIEEGIILNEFKADTEMDVSDVLALRELNIQLANGKPYGLIIIPGKGVSSTQNARELSADPTVSPKRIAIAIIVASTAQRLLARFFINYNKPFTPTRVFSDKQSALKWVRSIHQKSE